MERYRNPIGLLTVFFLGCLSDRRQHAQLQAKRKILIFIYVHINLDVLFKLFLQDIYELVNAD